MIAVSPSFRHQLPFLRFIEPDTEHNVRFVESKSKGYTSIPTIAQGTILKLVERVTYHKYTGGCALSQGVGSTAPAVPIVVIEIINVGG